MKSELMYKTISDELAKIKNLIDADNNINLNDRNIFLEDIIVNILNIIYDLSLLNTNLNISNYPSIDLKDEKSKVAVQVTTNVNHSKIQNTLNSFLENNYNKKYSTLYIVVFENHNYRTDFNINTEFKFDKKEHIITYNKLLKLIKNSSEEKLEKIYNYVCSSLRDNVYNVDWMISNSVKSLNNLGKRYNQKLNVYNYEERKIKMFFCANECKKEIFKLLNEFIVFIENNDIKFLINIDELLLDFSMSKFKNLLSYFEDLKQEIINKYKKSANEYNKIYPFQKQYNNLYNELNNLIGYYFSKVIIYKGAAGIGKSHTLAYFINHCYINNKKPALLILGQEFYSEENIENQLMKITNGKTNFDEMLSNINQLGIIREINIPIIIDGLNESCKNIIWKKGLIDFIEQVSKYSNLKLVLSIRDTYYDFCIPEEIESIKDILFCEHSGFSTSNLNAVKEFFKFYNLNMPIFQVINSEFNNPLFLTIYCEIVSKYEIDINPFDYKNFAEIYESYLFKINQKFIEKYEILGKINIVEQILRLYVDNWINTHKYLSYDEFLELLVPISSKYEIKSVEILNFIIDNGLFYKDIYLENEIIRFSYERYEKMSIARFLLKSIDTVEILKNELNDGFLKKYIDSSESFDNGVLEEIINIIQLKYKIDFLSLIEFDKIKFDYYIKKNYLKSLVWFKNMYDSKIILNNVNKLNQEIDYTNDIIDIFIKMSYIESNALNIKVIDEFLCSLSMPLLDYYWSIVIDDYYTNYSSKTIDNIMDYCLNYGNENLNDETTYLIGILLSWLFSSSNRYIRDRATKALTKLIINRHKVSIKLLEHFKEVKDLYILERLIAAIYGSVVRSSKDDAVEELSLTLYNVIYRNVTTVDNILIKIYALKYFRFVKNKYLINLYDDIMDEKKSEWYSSLPSNDEIDTYKFDFEQCNDDKRKYANETIIKSMVTEYGRGTSCYGDFGRYTLQNYLRPFSYLFDDIQLLSNVATKRIFEYGYDYKLFGDYDTSVKYFQSRHEHLVERIGKKYQWIATYELLSKLHDNFIPHYDVYSDDVIDLNNREYFDINHSKTLDKDQIYYVYYTLEEENTNLLNIDTTNYILSQKQDTDYFDAVDFDASIEEIYEKYLVKEIENIKYINLFGLYSFEDRKYNLKNVDRNSITMVCTAVVYSDKNRLEKSNYRDYSCGSYNELFNIQLFDFTNSLEYDLEYNRRYSLQDYNKNYKTCYEQYIWEGIYDESITGGIKVLSPQKWIVKEFNLIRKNEGEWTKDDEIICIHPNIDNGNQELLFRYDYFVEFLNRKKINVAWTIYCEKSFNNQRYSWRVNVFYDHKTNSFTKDIYDSEKWEIKPVF